MSFLIESFTFRIGSERIEELYHKACYSYDRQRCSYNNMRGIDNSDILGILYQPTINNWKHEKFILFIMYGMHRIPTELLVEIYKNFLISL